MSSWALTVGRWRGVPIRVHASVPIGLYVFSGFRFEPVWWACSLFLVSLHEVGHALVVKGVGGTPTEVMLTGYGGHCAWRGEVSPLGRAAIACGGVGAQLVLLLGVLGAAALGLVPATGASSTIFGALTFSNAWLMGFNLLPVAPLDGDEAWAFPLLLGESLRRRLTGRARGEWPVEAEGEAEAEVSSDTRAQAKALVDDLLDRAKRGE